MDKKQKLSLLRPVHFKALRTQLTESGLRFSEIIDSDDRESECPNIGEAFDDTPAYLRRLAASRPSSKVVINPVRPSAKSLNAMLEVAKKKASPDEKINVTYMLPIRYDQHWRRQTREYEERESEDSEGQIGRAHV